MTQPYNPLYEDPTAEAEGENDFCIVCAVISFIFLFYFYIFAIDYYISKSNETIYLNMTNNFTF